MTVTPENPIGLDGFEFVEFTSPDPARMVQLIEQLGFTAYSKHPTKAITRYKQGRINLLVNLELAGQVADGWCPFLLPISGLDAGIRLLEEGVERGAGAGTRPVVAPSIPTAVSDDPAKALELASWWVAFYLGSMGPLYRSTLRRLGRTTDRVYAQFDVAFRRHIHLFKNARLHVFLEISLHSDEWGFSWPSAATMSTAAATA